MAEHELEHLKMSSIATAVLSGFAAIAAVSLVTCFIVLFSLDRDWSARKTYGIYFCIFAVTSAFFALDWLMFDPLPQFERTCLIFPSKEAAIFKAISGAVGATVGFVVGCVGGQVLRDRSGHW